MGDKEKIAAGINLLRRLPPSKIERNSNAIASLIPDLADNFLSKIDKPLGKQILRLYRNGLRYRHL